MDEETKIQAKRAAKQASHAISNGTEAVEAVAEEAADHIDIRAMGRGAVALCVAAYAAGFAVSKFRQVFVSK